MPDQETLERVKKDKREGKAPSTQAGEFIREEVKHLREGKHGARSSKQAIAIGLSKARRAGVALGTPKNARAKVKRQAKRDSEKGQHRGGRVSPRRSAAAEHALEKEPRRAGSHRALSRQAHGAASRRTRASRSASAKKAAQTRKRRSKPRRWSQQVTEHSDAMTLEPRVFVMEDPHAVAESLKRSSDRSDRRKSSPFRSAMSMLNFYINRAGHQLTRSQRDVLERAKGELRELYGKAGR